jgi:hypothetical protein
MNWCTTNLLVRHYALESLPPHQRLSIGQDMESEISVHMYTVSDLFGLMAVVEEELIHLICTDSTATSDTN